MVKDAGASGNRLGQAKGPQLPFGICLQVEVPHLRSDRLLRCAACSADRRKLSGTKYAKDL